MSSRDYIFHRIGHAFRSVLQARGTSVELDSARSIYRERDDRLGFQFAFTSLSDPLARSAQSNADSFIYSLNINLRDAPRDVRDRMCYAEPDRWQAIQGADLHALRSEWFRRLEDHRMADYGRRYGQMVRASAVAARSASPLMFAWDQIAEQFRSVHGVDLASGPDRTTYTEYTSTREVLRQGPEMTATQVEARSREYERRIAESNRVQAAEPGLVESLLEAMRVLDQGRIPDPWDWDRIYRDMFLGTFEGGGKDVGSKEAQDRGMKLLRDNLTPEQRESFEKNKHFEVVGCDTGRRYRIREGRQINIDVLKDDGEIDHKICFLPEGGLVTGDVMIAQKLALECMESEALKVARRW